MVMRQKYFSNELTICLGEILNRCLTIVTVLVMLTGMTFAAESIYDDCANDDNPKISIPACTKLIVSGKEKGDFLGTLYAIRGLKYYNAGQYAKAVPDFTAAMRYKEGDHYDLFKMRATAYVLNHDYPHAITDYTKMIHDQPDQVVSYNGRAFAFLKMGNFDAALVDYTAALKINPDIAQSLYGRGLAKRAKGDVAGAQTDMTRAKELVANIADYFN